MHAAWLLLPALCALVSWAFAAQAQAYTYIVRPDSTTTAGSWSIDGGATIDSVLNEVIKSPVAPVTGFGYVSEAADGPSPFEVGLSDVTLRSGENVTQLRSWGYAQTGDGRSMDAELRTGTTPLASGSWPVGTPASWQSRTYTGTLTQAELDDLRQRRTLQGAGASTATIVYASYVEVTTDMPPPAPTITGGPPGAGTGTTATYTFTATPAAGFECRLERDGSVVSNWASCSSGVSWDLTTTGGDGDYTFRVRAIDELGVAGAESTRLYTLDRAPPAAPDITSSPTSPGADAAPAWSFTGEAGALLSCRLTRGATVISDWTLCSSPQSYNLGAEVDGTYTFQIQATDMAGNTGPDATSTYVLDRAAPAAPTFTSTPPGAGSSTSPSWSVSAEAGATLKFRLERGATVVSDWATGTSPRSFDLSAEVDATYTLRVTATDAAGNASSEAAGSYTLDRVAPPAPTVTAGPPADSSNASPSYSFTAEAGAATDCRLTRGATVVSDWGPCVTGVSYALGIEPDGTYLFEVRATDAAGNTGAVASRSYNLDRSAPAAPVITVGPSAPSSDPNASYSFTAEIGATAQCRIERGATVVSDWTACTTPTAYDLSGQADGTYTFRVKATDAAGNTGADATRSYVLDRAAPTAPTLTSTPPSAGSSTSPSWSFTAEAGATFKCRLERGAALISDWAACSSPKNYDLSAQVDGTYTFRVTATDAAGNESAQTVGSYILDRVAPVAPTITTAPAANSSNASPTYSFTAEAGASTECRLTRGATIISDWNGCVSGVGYSLGVQPDGTYLFEVRATDTAGNAGPVASNSYTLDRSAPVAPVITGGPPASSSDANPSYSFTYEVGANAQCRMERGATVVQDWTPCASPQGYNLAAQVDGFYTFKVRAVDAAGNVGAAASQTYELDRVAPPAPVLTGRPNPVTNDDTPTYTWVVDPSVSTYRCRIERGATIVSDWSPCASPKTYDVSGQPDGTYTLRLRATDPAANDSTETTDTFTLDRVAPVAPTITAGPTGSAQNQNPSYSFTAEAGSTTQCRIERGATVVSDWASCASPKAYDLSAQADGGYTFRVRATDTAGNQGTDATRAYTLDRTAPVAPTITSGPAANSNDDTPVYGFNGEAGATPSCRVTRGAALIVDWSPCSSPQGYDLSGDVDGTYTFDVRVTDAAGNVGAIATRNYVLDRSAPPAPTITAGPPADSNNASPSYSFTAEAGAATQCRLTRGATVVNNWGPCVTGVSYNLGVQPDGTYLFEVRATDAANNTGPIANRSFNLDRSAPAAPVITGYPPSYSSDAAPAVSFTYEPGAIASCRMERGATVVSDWTPCSSPYSYDLSAQPDGTYTWRVRATDAAGNTGSQTSGPYTLDRVAPTAPTLTSRPSALTNDDTPTWAFTGDADTVSFECRVLNGSLQTIYDWAPCTSAKTYDLTAKPDNTYTFYIRALDGGGLKSPSTTDAFAVDRVAPVAPTITAGPTGSQSTQNPTYSFSGEGGATLSCRIERGATIVSDWATCTSPKTYDLSLQPDTAYTFRVRATDGAGNTGTDATRSYTLDRVAPVAPVITSGPPADSSNAVPTYGFTGEPGATFDCRVTRGATTVINWTPCSTPQSYDISAQVDGTYTFEVRATDAALNTGPPASRTYNLDRVAPPAPTYTSTPGAATKSNTIAWSYTTAGGATATSCRLERGATVVSDWASCTSPNSYDVSALVDGTYTMRVRASDAAGNVGPDSASATIVDRAAPAAPAITAGPTGSQSVQNPTYSFTAEAGATTECRIERGATVVNDWAGCTSPKSFDLSLQPDATYTFRVRATDPAGNTGVDATRSYTLDRVAPAAPVITSGPPADSSDDTPTYGFTGEPGATFDCRITRGATTVVNWAPCSTPTTYDISAQVDGTYTFDVRATDAALNTGPAASRTYNLDRVAPPAPAFTATPGPATNSNALAWSYTTAGGATAATCRLERGATIVSDWASCTSPKSYDVSAQVDGTYVMRVRASDAAGNVGAESADTTVLDRSAPGAPTITGGPAVNSADDTPDYTFTAEPLATTTCRIERGATVVNDWTACASPATFNLAAQVDGSYTFRVRATDAAGNTGADTTRVYTLDRVAPPAPPIVTRPPASTNNPLAQWGWSTDPDAVSYECEITRGGTGVIGWAACVTPKVFDLTVQPDATYTLHVRGIDAAGNVGNETTDGFDLDRAAPAAPSITASPAADSQDDTPTYDFTAEAGAATACRVERGGTVISDWASCSAPKTFDLSAQPDGNYTFRVRATDPAGNTGADATRSYALDRTAPVAPTIASGPTGDSADDTPTYGFTAETAASTECRIQRGATVVSDWANCSSPKTFDISAEVDGTYTFRVRATDAAQNTGADATRSYVLDRAAPAAPAITSGPAADSTDDSPTYGFTGEAGATFECRLERGGTIVDAWAACSSPITYDVSSEVDGTYLFSVRATDAAQNTGAAATRSYNLDRVVPAAPQLDGSPALDGNDKTPTYDFSTTETGRSFECRMTRGATLVEDWTDCVTGKTYDLALQPDATYTFDVRAYNAAGTRSPITSDTYRFDTASPAPPTLTSGPAPDSTDDTPSWSITAEPGATLECRLDRGATTVAGWAACTSPVGYDLTSDVDGTYTVTVRATDAAGNTSGDATQTYNLDRTVPTKPVMGGSPPADGSDPNPSWDWTAEPGKRFECRLLYEGSVRDDWAACTSPFTRDLSGDPDGTYTFEVDSINPAGTRSPTLGDTYELDRQAPVAPTITSGPAADSVDDTPTWGFTGEAGATFECRLERGGAAVVDWRACTDPESQDISAEVDGTYTFRVRATDAAGNTGPDASRSYNLDRTTPGPVTITGRPASPGPDSSPNWAIAGDAPLTMECRITRGATVIQDWANCTTPYVGVLGGQPDGAYTFNVRQYNAAGTRGPDTTDGYVLDTNAPAAPVITARPGVATNANAPQWAFTAEAGAALECRLERGGVEVRAWAACASPRSFGLAGEPDGAYTFSVRATDAAGNVSAAATDDTAVDRVPPAPPGITAGPGPLGKNRAIAWSFNGEAGASFECRVDGDAGELEPFLPCASPRGLDLGGKPDGAYAFGVRAVDAAGNRSDVTTAPYRLDTAPGAVTINGGPGPIGRDRAPKWTYTTEDGASVTCRLDEDGASVFEWAPCAMPATYDLTGRPDGVFRLSLRATDAAGNEGPVADAAYELDTTPPEAPVIDQAPDSPGTDRTPSWRFSGENRATFACRLEATAPGSAAAEWAACASPFTADLVQKPDGEYRFSVRATDRAGNTGAAATSNYQVKQPEAPQPPQQDPPADEPKAEPRTTPAAPAEEAAPKKKKTVVPPPVKPKKPKPEPRKTAAKPSAPAQKTEAPRRSADDKKKGGILGSAGRAVQAVAKAIVDNPDKSVFPFSLILLVLGFLAIQNRIDRGDPKLALAPSFADPDLEFPPPPAQA